MTNKIKYSEIADQIKVLDWDFGLDGLEIQYTLGEKEILLIANPEQSCDIFKKHLWIEDYSGAGNDVIVEMETTTDDVDHRGRHKQESRTEIIEWSDFAMEFRLSQNRCLAIVARIEKDRLIDDQMNELKQLPKIIHQLCK